MKLYIIRHGQSTHNASADCPPNPDPPLTAIGRRQAELTARALRDPLAGAAALYASPMRRALETARPLQEVLRLPLRVVPSICEAGGLGPHAGMCRQQILDEWPECVLDESVTDQGWWPRVPEETEDALYTRARETATILQAAHTAGRHTVAIVTHGRFGSALVSVAIGLRRGGYSRFPFDNCAVTRVDFDLHDEVRAYPPPPGLPTNADGRPIAVRVRSHNDTGHLPPDMVTW
ncbi:MAG: histidine phosphatase family protein [Chthonomonadales bacterium]|nr:histidine phosphatase family protein [Chthonomonadales bacterium]